MPGEGFMLHAINTLRDNKKMLRKKSFFRREKGFLSLKEEYLKASINKKLNHKKLTKEELEQIRNDVIRKNKKENIRAYLLTISSLTIISTAVYFIGISIYKDYEKHHTSKIPQNIEKTKRNNANDDFGFLTQSGDEWMGKMNWKNAIYQYENALSISPDHQETILKLADAYTNQCYFEHIDCEKAAEFINEKLKKFPNNEKLLESKSLIENK